MDGDTVYPIGALVTAISGVALKLIDGWAKSSNATKLAIAQTIDSVSKRQSEDNIRVVNTMIASAQTETKLMAEIESLKDALNTAVEARRRDGDQLSEDFQQLKASVDGLRERLSNYEEFKKRRPTRPG